MANQGNPITPVLIIAVFVGAILALYFLSKMLVAIGIFLIFVGLVATVIGLFSQNLQVVVIGFVVLLAGLGCAVIGNEGVNFFEENPTGKNLLDNSNKIVNVTADAVDDYNKLTKATNSINLFPSIGG